MSASEGLGYRPTSAALRRKIAVLEGSTCEDGSVSVKEPALTCVDLAAASEVPAAAEKVFAAVVGWDDLALADMLESFLGFGVDRVSVQTELQLGDPRHAKDDTVIARCVTTDQKTVNVLLKSTLLLLPSAQALSRIMHNTLHHLIEQLWEKGDTYNYQWSKCVALTVVKDHPSATFAGFPTVPGAPWCKRVRWGIDAEPWNLCEFVFVSLSDFERAGAPVDTPLAQWCWFLSRNQQCVDPAQVPPPVRDRHAIRSVWMSCARVSGGEEFCREWGDAAIDTAHAAMVTSAEHSERAYRQQAALDAHRIRTNVGQQQALTAAWKGDRRK
eukprot:TRINITY_DN17049_c0_g1_i1.p1 TRINITY_DN17049_c0_g1~~TRINITY_DN17049_c0_g1_i1.p1  ORF type:complete len:348 (+),score=109.56 TRINITY_DN17049_c0_g1_i1:61-1044(+)